ncbi:M48 family metalloprotease [Sneathiella sp. P13V-1]|uniref:M48 family metalloprotease n=1 Tax=Sneathiella sp. P13V-1 TaxID=2697366 RepID=UPI00187B2604|nr:M48 family metalloprotease [Sneathiella sp. P13V-1]MBE7637171.1 M48 family metalloprotease [Sneathiella sp. P13V-1]
MLLQIQTVMAQSKLSFIRDAEIEHTLRSYATPLFTSAGLNAEDVSIHLVNSKVINAFVAGGQRMFFFTGLLERVENPNQLKGVIAHETGHISGGHLARTQEALRNASTKSILGYLLGAAVIFAGGGKAGAAVIGGAQAEAQKSFLKYSREQESSADQASIKYLTDTGSSGQGMVEFLEILGEQETVAYGKIDPYWRSHPISGERIAALRSAVDASPYKDKPASKQDWIALERMQAKLYGFTKGLRKTLRKYPVSDKSLGARYARSIAYFKYPDLEKGLKEIDNLLLEYPADPYFHELKGQMLFENGDPYSAVPSLKIAADVAPYQPLILTLYGTVLLATGDNQYLEEAVRILRTSTAYDPYATNSWNQLAIAYNRLGDTGNLSLATAERFALLGKWDKAIFHAKRVQENMSAGSPGYLRADDIITIASRQLNK